MIYSRLSLVSFFMNARKFYDALHFFHLANHVYDLFVTYRYNEIKNDFIDVIHTV